MLYTKDDCGQCVTTVRQLARLGVALPETNIETEPAALAFVLELGYKQAPVVYIDRDTHWSGFRPELLKTHFKKEN